MVGAARRCRGCCLHFGAMALVSFVDETTAGEFLGGAVCNQKELVGNDRAFVLDRIFFWNPKMDESDRDC